MPKVQLYVYDLSGGVAKALSMQMTGKQIDGIWHTSVVVFGREIFYGQGISITAPGRSHHGQPLQIIDFGETAIDEETFNEYLNEVGEHYTADKYHLLDFNCNSFTNDVIGFLTGEHIPTWIRDLPADFLSTPFGASLRPMIDNMFRRPTPGATPPPGAPQTTAPAADVSNLLLQAVAQRATAPAPNQPFTVNPASSTVAAPVHIATNPSSLDSLIKSHKASVIFFTSSSCGPCRMVEPTFEDIAGEKAGPDVVFIKVSLDVPGAYQVAGRWEVRATPTFIMCLDGERVDEVKGADRGELKTRVDLLLYQAFPPHPHMSLKIPLLRGLSTQTIIYEQVPDLGKLSAKLQATTTALRIEGYPSIAAIINATRQGANSINDQVVADFGKASDGFITTAPPQDLFPLLDLWRITLLNQDFATRCALGNHGLVNVVTKVSEHVEKLGGATPKALALTGLRLQSNISSNPALLRYFMSQRSHRSSFTQVAVSGLLHEDTGVRTAASTLVFNISTHLQRSRRQSPTRPDAVEDGDWEVEIITAILESLSRESDPGIVHRLVSAFGFVVMFSPWFTEQTGPLLEVLEAKATLEAVAKASKAADVSKLARECVLLCDTPF